MGAAWRAREQKGQRRARAPGSHRRQVGGAARLGPAAEEVARAVVAGRGAIEAVDAAVIAAAIEPATDEVIVGPMTGEDAAEAAVERDVLAEEDLLAALPRAPDAAQMTDQVAVLVG